MVGDDFDAILRQCSEVTLPEDDVDIRTPPTLQQHLNHVSVKRPTSIFEDEDYDGVTRFTSGRGRALRAIYNPVVNDRVSLETDEYMRNSIRKVGFGYSNEFIEKKWNKKSSQSPSPVLPVDQQFCDIQEEERESSEKSLSPVKRNVSSPVKKAVAEKKPPPLSVILGKKTKSDKSEVKKIDQKKKEENHQKKKEENHQKKKEENHQKRTSNLNPDAPEFKSNFCSSPINSSGRSSTHHVQHYSPAKSGSDKENGTDYAKIAGRDFIGKHDFYSDSDPYRFYSYDNEPPFNISSDDDFPALKKEHFIC
ncbi:uncharacterized protein [Diabrotica undecimpunctata]|uniref:uncharacterized protein n=1 Tax=Diabrotica undecimpunctata TaxID=50387 RepID=UPI003B63AC08